MRMLNGMCIIFEGGNPALVL